MIILDLLLGSLPAWAQKLFWWCVLLLSVATLMTALVSLLGRNARGNSRVPA